MFNKSETRYMVSISAVAFNIFLTFVSLGYIVSALVLAPEEVVYVGVGVSFIALVWTTLLYNFITWKRKLYKLSKS